MAITVRVEYHHGAASRVRVLEERATGELVGVVMEGNRHRQALEVVGGWRWQGHDLPRSVALISGSCYLCGVLELRSFGWLVAQCLPGKFHLWQRPL